MLKPTTALAARVSPVGGWGGGEGARLCLQSSCKSERLWFAPGRRARRGEEINPLPRSENDCLWCTHCCLPLISRRPNTLEQVARTQAVPTRSQGREGCRLESRLNGSSSPSSGSYRSCCLRPPQACEPPEERRGPCGVKAGPGPCSRPVCVPALTAPRPVSLLVPGHAAAVTRGSAFPSPGGVTSRVLSCHKDVLTAVWTRAPCVQAGIRRRPRWSVCAARGHPLLLPQGCFGWGSRGHPSRPSSGLPTLRPRVTHLTLLHLLMGTPPPPPAAAVSRTKRFEKGHNSPVTKHSSELSSAFYLFFSPKFKLYSNFIHIKNMSKIKYRFVF